jgi:hypothetical protein
LPEESKSVQQPSDEMKKRHCFFQAQAEGFCNNRKVRISRFSPKWEYTVASLAKHFLIANSPKISYSWKKVTKQLQSQVAVSQPTL